MIGISHISSYIPERTESNYEKMERFGIDDAFIRDKIGVEYVTRIDSSEDTSDIAYYAAKQLLEETRVPVQEIDCLVVCTQNPDQGGLPHVSAMVQAKLGMTDDCACFDIGLGCSGYVYGLSVVSSFMQANGLKKGLLVTADPYSKIIDPGDKNTVLLFGDAASATLLCEDGPWKVTRSRYLTRGSDGAILRKKDNRLVMEGRLVFNFCAINIPIQIRKLLDESGRSVEDIDQFFLHQGSRYIVTTIASRAKLPAEKVPIALAKHGNTVSSSIPLMLARHIHDNDQQRYLLCGFGVGMSCATALLERSAPSRREP